MGDFECTKCSEPKNPFTDSKFWKTVDSFTQSATNSSPHVNVDALTLHFYPDHGYEKNTSKDLLDPKRLDVFGTVFRRFQKKVNPAWKGEIWAGETASLQNG